MAVNHRETIDLFDGCTLDLARGCVIRAGEPLHLRPQTYQVLKYLAENKGRLISKDRLIEEVWQGRAVTDSSLGKCIEEVREVLGPGARQYIRNVRGRGYIFEAGDEGPAASRTVSVRSEQIDILKVLVHDEESDAESIGPSELPGALSAPRAHHWRTRTLIVAGLFVIVVAAAAAVGLYRLITHGHSQAGVIAGPFRNMDISRVTTSGKLRHAAISSDGKYVASITEDSEGDSVWVRHVAAPSNVRVAGPTTTEYVWVTFAPDGDSVYYLALDRDKGDTTLYRVPVLGGPSSKAAYDVGPVSFSPDGKQTTFVRMYREESHLIVAGADWRNERTLATRRQPDFFSENWNAPAWSADGKTIACPIRLNDERGAYETVMGINVADGAERPLTSRRWHHVGQPVWIADGSGLLVTASENSTGPEQVWHVALANGEASRVTHDLNDYRDLSLTADSARLAAVQDQTASSIWIAAEADANSARQIVSDSGGNVEVAWTPAGLIIYSANAGNSSEIWVTNAAGSNPKQLTVDARVNRGLTASADGRYIFFASDRSGHFNIWRVDADGRNLRQITAGDGEFYPDCTPDGRWVVYQRGEIEPNLWKVPTDGGEPVQLTESRASRPAVSPDGTLIAYHYLDSKLDRWGVGIVSSAGGQVLKRFDFPPAVAQRFVRWAPKGQSVAFANRPGGVSEIWLQPLDGSAAKQLTGYKAERILGFDWSPDGHSLAVVRGVSTSDVVLIEQKQE